MGVFQRFGPGKVKRMLAQVPFGIYEQKHAMKMVHTIFRPDIYATEGKI